MKKIYFLSSVLSLSLTAIAQPTLTGADLNPTIGETMSMIRGDYISEGSGGNNLTWDLSAATNNSSYGVTVDASTGLTPNANIDFNYGGQSDTYYFNDATGQKLYNQFAYSIMMTYSDPMQFLTFPLSMSTSYIDSFEASYTSSGVLFYEQGTIEVVADGYGTLITPAGTYTNVLRVTTTENYTNTYDVTPYIYHSVSVNWYKAGFHHVLASCVTTTDRNSPGLLQYTEYMVAGVAGITELSVNNSSVYPNPVETQLFVNPGQTEITNYDLFSLNGELIYSSTESATSTIEINMSSMDKGIYILKLTRTDNSVETRKIVKN